MSETSGKLAPPEIKPGELKVTGVSKSYGAGKIRKEVVRACTEGSRSGPTW